MKSLDTRFSLRIEGSPAKVWRTLTERIDRWWPAEFYAGGSEGARSYHLEAEPGGKMYERWQDGGGVLWGTVVAVDPGRQLQVQGSTFPNWGGPSIWFGTWTLEPDGAATRLSFSESVIGSVSETSGEQKEKGWSFLLESLRSSVEDGTPPIWED